MASNLRALLAQPEADFRYGQACSFHGGIGDLFLNDVLP